MAPFSSTQVLLVHSFASAYGSAVKVRDDWWCCWVPVCYPALCISMFVATIDLRWIFHFIFLSSRVVACCYWSSFLSSSQSISISRWNEDRSIPYLLFWVFFWVFVNFDRSVGIHLRASVALLLLLLPSVRSVKHLSSVSSSVPLFNVTIHPLTNQSVSAFFFSISWRTIDYVLVALRPCTVRFSVRIDTLDTCCCTLLLSRYVFLTLIPF
jgi:hypothetical protein